MWLWSTDWIVSVFSAKSAEKRAHLQGFNAKTETVLSFLPLTGVFYDIARLFKKNERKNSD